MNFSTFLLLSVMLLMPSVAQATEVASSESGGAMSAADAPVDGRLRVSVQLARPFQGEISIEMARTAALSAARVEAMSRAQKGLAGLEELRLMLNSQGSLPQPDAESSKSLPELQVFGYALMRQESKFEESVSGLPPRLALELRCAFVSVGPAQLREPLVYLFKTPGLLENYALAAQLEKDSLAAYDLAAKNLLALPPVAPVQSEMIATPDTAEAPEAPETAEITSETPEILEAPDSAESAEILAAVEMAKAVEMAALAEAAAKRANAVEELQSAYRALQGARAYLELLPDLYASSGLHAGLLEPLEQAVALLPESFLLQSEIGRLYLWLEMNSKAGEALDKAITLNPDFAQPYAHRGALWLLLQRPALALDDLSRAIALDPQNPEYYYGRAVVRQVDGDNAAMCADLEQCCLLGECDPYEWAKANTECP